MLSTLWLSFAYCILLVIPLIDINSLVSADIQCISCGSSVLKENWEITGLPTPPTNESTFFTDQACFANFGNDAKYKVTCLKSCFFASYALRSGEYAVVRGCVEDFVGNSGLNPNTQTPVCEISASNNPVSFAMNNIPQPIVGWYVCNQATCNSFTIDADKLGDAKKWTPGSEVVCKEPTPKSQCIECQHFNGKGHCHHDQKTVCQGNYCTKLVGKLDGRWFEVRGCTELIPMGVESCIAYNKDIIIEQMGTTLNQSYWANNCVCKGEKCNTGSMRQLFSLPTLIAFSASLFLIIKLVGL